MSVLYVIIMAVVQGLTEFLPVSSFGHLYTAGKLFGINENTGLLLEGILHLGTAAAIIFLFKKELKRILLELLGMILDSIGNLNLYIHNKRTGDDLNYARIIHGTYRKYTALLVVSFIPALLLGGVSGGLVQMASGSSVFPGIGFLLTGIFLLVTDLSGAGGEKGPREAGFDSAIWIGICQGIAFFPGISRMGLTLCAALLCGYSRKFAVRFSVVMSLPALIGAFISQAGQFVSSDMTAGLGAVYVSGGVIAGLVGCLVIRFMLNLTQKTKLRYFAIYSFIAGGIALAVNFI